MNCSTGLYHTPFTKVPVLMALKRAVTTASCKKNTNSHHQEFMNVQIYLPLHWILLHKLLYLIKTSNGKWLLSLGVNIWGGTSRVLQLPPGWVCPQKAAYLKHYVPRSRLCYLLVQLEKLHRHIALKFRLPPAGKHPKPGDHHRVEDLEIQGDGWHVSGDNHRGVRHRHDLYLCILACHWNRGRSGITAQAHKIFITIPTCWPSLFGDEDRASQERESAQRRRKTLVNLHHQQFEERVLRTAVFKASFCSWARFLNYKRAVYYPRDQWKDQGC